MNEQAKISTSDAEAINAAADSGSFSKSNFAGGKRSQVVIQARFHPNGLINTINQRPDHLSPQDWFDYLCRAAPSTYQPLAGGRGAFHIGSEDFEAILRDQTA